MISKLAIFDFEQSVIDNGICMRNPPNTAWCRDCLHFAGNCYLNVARSGCMVNGDGSGTHRHYGDYCSFFFDKNEIISLIAH